MDVCGAFRSVVLLAVLVFSLCSVLLRRPLLDMTAMIAVRETRGRVLYQWPMRWLLSTPASSSSSPSPPVENHDELPDGHHLRRAHGNFMDAMRLVAAGQHKRAELPLRRVLEDVENWAALQVLGDVLLEVDVTAASNAYLDAAVADSASSLAITRLGQACGEVGDFDDMRAQCIHALWLNPRNGAAMRCLARGLLLSQAEAPERAADTALALRYLSRAAFADPSDVRSVLQYCDQLLVHGAEGAAEACYEDLLREHSKYMDVLLRLGMLAQRHEGIPKWGAAPTAASGATSRSGGSGSSGANSGGRGRALLEVVAQAMPLVMDPHDPLLRPQESPHFQHMPSFDHLALHALAGSEVTQLETVHRFSSKHMELERWWMWALPQIARYKLDMQEVGLPLGACLAYPQEALSVRYGDVMEASSSFFKSNPLSSFVGEGGSGDIVTTPVLLFESPALSAIESSPALDAALATFIKARLRRWFPGRTCSDAAHARQEAADEDEDAFAHGSSSSGGGGCKRLFAMDIGAGRGSVGALLKHHSAVLTAIEQAQYSSFPRYFNFYYLLAEVLPVLKLSVLTCVLACLFLLDLTTLQYIYMRPWAFCAYTHPPWTCTIWWWLGTLRHTYPAYGTCLPPSDPSSSPVSPRQTRPVAVVAVVAVVRWRGM